MQEKPITTTEIRRLSNVPPQRPRAPMLGQSCYDLTLPVKVIHTEPIYCTSPYMVTT